MQKFIKNIPNNIFVNMPEFFQKILITISKYTGIDKFMIITIVIFIFLLLFKFLMQEINNK